MRNCVQVQFPIRKLCKVAVHTPVRSSGVSMSFPHLLKEVSRWHTMLLPLLMPQLDTPFSKFATPAIIKVSTVVTIIQRDRLEERYLAFGTLVAVWSRA